MRATLNRDREAFASKRDDVDLKLVKELDTDNMHDKMDEKFKYGEPRLSSLIKIYLFIRCPLLVCPFMSHSRQYRNFLQANLT